MTADDVIALVRDALQVDTVTMDSAMGNLRRWDSLSQIQVMLALEKRLGDEIPGELFGELTSVAAILKFLSEEGRLSA